VQVTVRLKKWKTHTGSGNEEIKTAVSASETELVQMIKEVHTPSQMARWSDLESSMLMYIGLEFADGNDEFTPVPASSFAPVPTFGALFAPPESPPYTHGFYEFDMKKGTARIKFKIAFGATTTKLKKEHKGRQFRFVVKSLNPFLCGLQGFTVRSRPFALKSVLHNDARSEARFVQTSDGVVASPACDVPTV
jgi:hypothetical protein